MSMDATIAEPTRPVRELRPLLGRLGPVAFAVCGLVALGASLALRLWDLGNLPGVNGDEAWSGVQALRILHGEPIAWRTPSGNPINPFFLIPQVLLHAWLPPSFALLRSVAASSGILALVLNFWLCAKAWGKRMAAISTLLLAVLPINIAYSRFGWDASQTLLATTLVMYFSLLTAVRTKHARRWFLATLIALAAAILVHPTNVFTAPLALAGAVYRWRETIWRLWTCRRAAINQRAFLVVCTAVAAPLLWVTSPWLTAACLRGFSPGRVFAFVQNYMRLFSGATVYRFITGAIADEPASLPTWRDFDLLDLLAWVAVTASLIGFLRLIRGQRQILDGCLAAGWGLSLAAFYFVAGPEAISPHLERYGICLIAPGSLVLARGAWWWLQQTDSRRHVARSCCALVVGLLLVGFHANYFEFVIHTGGMSHRTFRTALVEPKLQALRIVSNFRDPRRAALIVADEWWNYWPVRYLAYGETNVRVMSRHEWTTMQKATAGQLEGELWVVEFTGGDARSAFNEQLPIGQTFWEETQILDYGCRPLLSVFRANAEEFFQNY